MQRQNAIATDVLADVKVNASIPAGTAVITLVRDHVQDRAELHA